ncbi:MAG TPA: ABC transporter permease subunit [Caproiciproducens sp.]|nr:ABC transporter permease subunit [Caproiciproducens sp.]
MKSVSDSVVLETKSLARSKKKTARLRALKKYRSLYVIMGVIVAYFIIFNYVPIFWGTVMSFQDFKIGNTIANAPWVGWENYKTIFTDPDMQKLIVNTLLLSIYRLLWGFWPSIVLAIFIFDLASAKYKKLSQTIVYVPYFFSWVIVYGIVYAFFSGNGFINSMLSNVHIGKIDFLMSSSCFRPLLVGSQIWKGLGWGTILYFAALTGVNPELYEACKIDGAGPIRRTLAVTLPAMMPVIIFSLIMALGNILNNDFEQVLLFYNSSVYDVGDIIDTWVYRVGLGQMRYSLGAAVGILKSAVGFVLIIGSNYLSRKLVGRGMW